jgi:Mg-chelatase subunit ChlD
MSQVASSFSRLASRMRLNAEPLEDRVNPGTGTFVPGTEYGLFNFAVSIRFDATEAQIAKIQSAFQAASLVIADATDGKHRFGEITIVNKSRAGDNAEYWINAGTGRANAWWDTYGKRGQHVQMYFDSHFVSLPSADGDAYTIAHEFAHHAYGIRDEYRRPNPAFDASRPDAAPRFLEDALCAPPSAQSSSLSYSLMDNYHQRGGRQVASKNPPYTLNEFCVSSNHDPSGINEQSRVHKKSCWETLATCRFPVEAPEKLPVDAPPAPHFVTFRRSEGGATIHLVMDRSGSMEIGRLGPAQNGARALTHYLEVPDRLGVVSYSDKATVDHPLRPTNDAGLFDADTAIRGLIAQGGTNMRAGLQAALDQITSLPKEARSPNEVILLFTDGEPFNVGSSPLTLIPALQAAGVSVISVGLGVGVATGAVEGGAILQKLADETNGFFLQANRNFDLLGQFFTASMLTIQSPMVGYSPALDIGRETPLSEFVSVSPGSKTAIFAMNRLYTDKAVEFQVRSPSGKVFTASPGSGPSFVDKGVYSIFVPNPKEGRWKMTATVPGGNTFFGSGGEPNQIRMMASADSSGTRISMDVGAGQPSVYPDPIPIQATPTLGGQPLLGVKMTAEVTRPDGSVVTVPLLDGGADGDSFSGDGIYTALFSQYSSEGNGAYMVTVKADTTGGGAIVGAGETIGGAPGDSVPEPASAAPDLVLLNTTTVVAENVPVLPGGFVTGRVFDDVNGNGTFEVGEPGFDGVLVYPDFNANGVRESTETLTFTAPDGTYSIEITNPGNYVIRIEEPEGETQVLPDPTANVNGSKTVTGVDFPLGLPAIPKPNQTVFAVAADRGGSPVLSVRDADGKELRSIAAFDPGFAGGVRVAAADFNGDGVDDFVVGTGPGATSLVRVIDGNTQAELFQVAPFESTFTGGVLVAAGDLTGDGVPDLAISPDDGGGPRVRLFNGAGFQQIADFFGIEDLAFRGGARVAVGDLNGDGTSDVIVAAGFGGGPRVAVFDGATVGSGAPTRLVGDFFLFEPGLRNGAYVAAGDLDADGNADLIGGGGPGGGPRVLALSGRGLVSGTPTQLANFFAGDPADRGGARVAVKDLNGDSQGDVLVGVGAGSGSRVTGYSGDDLSGTSLVEVLAFDAIPGFTGGVFVG